MFRALVTQFPLMPMAVAWPNLFQHCEGVPDLNPEKQGNTELMGRDFQTAILSP